MEKWIEIDGYNDYMVSNKGRVKRVVSAFNSKPRMLKTTTNAHGYSVINLRRDCKTKTHYVHRLVCQHFIGDSPDGKNDAAHWDGDKSNNRVTNLRWASRQENNMDKHRQGKMPKGASHHNCILSDQEVIDIRNMWSTGDITQIELGRAYGVSSAYISEIVNHKKRMETGQDLSNLGYLCKIPMQ